MLEMVINEVKGRYSSELVHVLDHLLNDDSEERPSFADIKEYIVKEIQFQSSKVWPA